MSGPLAGEETLAHLVWSMYAYIITPTVTGQDFVPNGAPLTFASGTTSSGVMCSSVMIIDDGNLEGDQTFTVTISTVSPGSSSITLPSTTITIHDNHGKWDLHTLNNGDTNIIVHVYFFLACILYLQR